MYILGEMGVSLQADGMSKANQDTVPVLGELPHPRAGVRGGNGRSPECQMPPERPQSPLEQQCHINEVMEPGAAAGTGCCCGTAPCKGNSAFLS